MVASRPRAGARDGLVGDPRPSGGKGVLSGRREKTPSAGIPGGGTRLSAWWRDPG
jgi:hypothetical protein